MLTVRIPRDAAARIHRALEKAGSKEMGGVLMGEHIGHNAYRVCDLTLQGSGTFASFVRAVSDAIRGLQAFFTSTSHDYRRFNYLGEWHSHPSFIPLPSQQDDLAMRAIATDPSVGATFVVLLVVKLEQGSLVGTAHTYLPDGSKSKCTLEVEA